MKPNNKFGRRNFLKTLGISGAGLWAGFHLPLRAARAATRQGDRLAGAVIGLGNRGRGLAEWQMPPYADVVAICDVDLRKTTAVAKTLLAKTGRKVEIHQDYRRVLERKDIQMIANATCEHWHTKINVDACRAGKDVYCEKPLSLTISEGQMLQKVVKETGRIIQVGTQQRSGPQFQIACSLVRNGRIGSLKQIAVILPGGGFRERPPATPGPVPAELNWDVWSGQAPLHAFSEARLSSYRSWFDYGGGLVTDWGAHHMDIAHWGMGGAEVGPVGIEAAGYSPNYGKPNYPDQFGTFAARLEYPQGIELYFLSSYSEAKSSAQTAALQKELYRIYGKVPASILEDKRSGVLFMGSNGTIFVSRDQVAGDGIGELEKIPLPENENVRWRACLFAHMQNFLDCVKTRQTPVSCVPEQHRTLIPCQLTNIALRLGRKLKWDPQGEQFIGDVEANGMLRRVQREPYRVAS